MTQSNATTGRASLGRFVVATTVAGAVTVGIAVTTGATEPVWEWRVAGVLLALLVGGVFAPLRVHHRGGSTGFTLDDGVVVAMLFALPGRWVPLLVVTATMVAHLARRAPLRKVAYNAGNRGLSASAALVVFTMLRPGPEVLALSSVIAAVGAILTYNLVNLAVNAELRHRLTGSTRLDSWADLVGLYAITSAANTAYGLLLAFVAVRDVVATLLAGVLMVGLYLGYRGYAGVLEDRRRTERLHALTRTLIDVTASDESVKLFLDDLRSLLGAEGAAFVLLEDGDVRRVVRDGTAAEDESCPYLDATIHRDVPVVATGLSGEEAAHRDVMAAPVRYEQRTVGAIAVYDRYGLEPWDDADTTLLSTIANEAAVAVKNVELFNAVERERALLAEESRKLSDIVDNASDGIAMVEADGRVAAWNDAMATITGLTAGQTFGQPWFTVLRLRDRHGADLVPEGNNALAATLRGERLADEVELQVLRRDGEWRWLRCSVSPIERHGRGALGAVLVARDVTREREVEELKGDFVATVSHELRTPLTPLRGFLDTIIAKGERLDDEQTEGILTAMRGQVSRLERLVGDLLVVADVERRELGLRVEATDLVGLLPDAVARVIPPIPEQRLHVEAPDWLGAIADETAVLRIVGSLLDNAARHTSGAIVLRAYRDDEAAIIEVEDEGPGIAPWDHDQVFRRFGRLGNHLHRTQGPGLGLPIARALAEALNGELTIESDVGHGATFRLTLPASAPRAVPDAHETAGRTDSASA